MNAKEANVKCDHCHWMFFLEEADNGDRCPNCKRHMLSILPPSDKIETMQVYGTKNGIQVYLGDVPLDPEMKIKEIVRQYFDNEFDVELAEIACEEFYEWLKQQNRLK